MLSLAAGAVFLSPHQEVLGQQTCDRSIRQIQQAGSDVLPWEKDNVGHSWEARRKYYLTVSVTGIEGQPDAALEFAAVDANLVSQTLCRFGYQPVVEDASKSILKGEQATSRNVDRIIDGLSIPDDPVTPPLLVIYYSGHAVTTDDGKDLYLQFHDQDKISVAAGTSLSEIVKKLRSAYQGDLVLVLDACFSGKGAVGRVLGDLGPNLTTVLTSSGQTEYSLPVTLQNGTTMSAFTSVLLDGLNTDWESVDSDHDGIVWPEDIGRYATYRLEQYFGAGRITKRMTPYVTTIQNSAPLAYDRLKLKNIDTLPRKLFVPVTVTFPAPSGNDVASVLGRVFGMAGKPDASIADVASAVISVAGKVLATVPKTAGSAAHNVIVQLPRDATEFSVAYIDNAASKVLAVQNFDLAKVKDRVVSDPRRRIPMDPAQLDQLHAMIATIKEKS